MIGAADLQLSDLLGLLRETGRQARFNGHPALPADAAAAYRLVLEQFEGLEHEVAAWKLGATTHTSRQIFQTDKIYFGPLLSCEVFFCGCEHRFQRPESARAEAELALRVKKNIAPGGSIPPAEDLFDAYAPALELPWSAVADLPEAGLSALLADRCAAGALLVGVPAPLGPGARGGLFEIWTEAGPLTAGRVEEALLMPPLEAAVEAVSLITRSGFAVRRGQWIATGGITACVDLPADELVELRLDGRAVISLRGSTLLCHKPASEPSPNIGRSSQTLARLDLGSSIQRVRR